jgi:hypothetical protein
MNHDDIEYFISIMAVLIAVFCMGALYTLILI